jgi:hypothetical protein
MLWRHDALPHPELKRFCQCSIFSTHTDHIMLWHQPPSKRWSAPPGYAHTGYDKLCTSSQPPCAYFTTPAHSQVRPVYKNTTAKTKATLTPPLHPDYRQLPAAPGVVLMAAGAHSPTYNAAAPTRLRALRKPSRVGRKTRTDRNKFHQQASYRL